MQANKRDIRLTHMIELRIDNFTPCLEHTETGEIYMTEIHPVTIKDLQIIGPKHGWNDFDWTIYYQNPLCKLVKLTLVGDNDIQGIVAYEPKEGYIEIHLVRSAPWNVQGKRFTGVGAHLFAIVCKESFDSGFEGYVTFYSKSNLMSHYREYLGASVINEKERKLVLDTTASRRLVSTYF